MSDQEIYQAYMTDRIDMAPSNLHDIQPASWDMHLGSKLLVPNCQFVVDPLIDSGYFVEHTLDEDTPYFLPPGRAILAHTEEYVTLNDPHISADIAGVSSLGRFFLFVHVTAGFIDPGWEGRLTLELYNASPWILKLSAGMRIAQLRFYQMHKPATRMYKDTGRYHASLAAEASKYSQPAHINKIKPVHTPY
jgi:dCTP deaminase